LSTQAVRAEAPESAGEPVSPEVTIIRPSRGWAPLNIGELWRYRELLYFLTWRDIKVRYKQTALGAAWAILQPVLTTVVFTIVFGHFAKMPSEGVPYPIFSFAGLLPWTFFATALSLSSNSLVTSSNLVSKVYFPRLIVPLAASMTGVVDFCIAFFILIGLMIYYHVAFSIALVLVPVFLVLALIVALAVGLWLSALNVQYRDVRYTVPFLTQLWMYATPVVYPANLITGKLHIVVFLNPMSGVIEGFRWAVLGGQGADLPSLLVSGIVTVVILIGGVFYFRRTEQRFADVI
jgi:lipopolysaccharide transport system permease protein